MRDFGKPEAIVMVLDSEPTMRAVLSDALESANYMAVSAADLGEAVQRLAETPPDLLITRPYINNMPGWVAAEYLRTRQNGLPVLIVAGFMKDDRTEAQYTIKDFHTFPEAFGREDLVAAVKRVLAGK